MTSQTGIPHEVELLAREMNKSVEEVLSEALGLLKTGLNLKRQGYQIVARKTLSVFQKEVVPLQIGG